MSRATANAQAGGLPQAEADQLAQGVDHPVNGGDSSIGHAVQDARGVCVVRAAARLITEEWMPLRNGFSLCVHLRVNDREFTPWYEFIRLP